MRSFPYRIFRWHAGSPAWGAGVVATLGCALPLSLGLTTGHSGFLVAAYGAFLASQADPLQRFGMLRMLLFTGLGALSAGLGYWSGSHPLLSLGLFAVFGLLLAWLQRFGNEAGKLGVGLAICLVLGQSQYGTGQLHNPAAVGTLFILGALWVMLLAFGLRGAHGLRMWPRMPRLPGLLRALRRHARRLPRRQWLLHALGCSLALALAGLAITLGQLAHGYWLSLLVICSLQIELQDSLVHTLQASMAGLCGALLSILLGYSLQSPAQMVATLLPLIFFCRTFQAHRYGLFVLQCTLCFVLLSESLAVDWDQSQARLFNSLLGVTLAMLVALLMHGLRQHLGRAGLPVSKSEQS